MRTVILFSMCLSFLLLRGNDHACAHQTSKNHSHLQFGNESKKQIASVKKSAVSFDDNGSFAVESEDEDFFVSHHYIPAIVATIALCLFGFLPFKQPIARLSSVLSKPMVNTSTPKFIQQRIIRL